MINSLADSGPGTLRECATAFGPRTCIFETSGRIRLNNLIEIKEPFITIAGQTAPAPGITLTGAGFKVSTHDVVIRHLAIRPGDDPTGPKAPARDGVTINGGKEDAYNIVLDHLSLTWALDENFDSYGSKARDVTVQNTIMAEGLFHSIHPDGPHSMGALIGDDTQKIAIHGCLLAHNNDRNPRQKAGSSLEFVNNVVYNWGGTMSGAHEANPSDTERTGKATLLKFAGNNYIAGPDSPARAPLYAKPVSPAFRVFVGDNIGPTRPTNAGNQWLIADLPESPHRVQQSPLAESGIAVTAPDETFIAVLNSVGSRPHERNGIDARIIQDVKDKSGSIKDCVSGCDKSSGGYPEIPVRTRILKPPADQTGDSNHNGYTNLEDWLNCFADTVETGADPAKCS